MRTKLSVVATILAAVLALAPDAQTRRALIVGINEYAPPGSQGTGTREAFSNLGGAVNDAQAIRAILMARYGFAEADTRLLLNGAATRDGILGAFREHLVEASEEGDIAFFFYAGHGSVIRNSKSKNAVHPFDQVLVPHDANRDGGRPIWDKEVRALLNDVLDKGAHVTAIFDACHSGTITRGMPRDVRDRWVPPDDRDAAELFASVPVDDRPAPYERGAIVMSAAQDDESAKERVDEDGTAHGYFTYALLHALRTSPIDESARRIFGRLRAHMRSEGPRQTPNMEVADHALGSPLVGPATGEFTGSVALPVRLIGVDEREGQLRLDGGSAMRIAAGTELVSGETKLRIVEVPDLTSSWAEVVEGSMDDVEIAQLFEVETWVTDPGSHLAVWTPPALPAERIEGLRSVLGELAAHERFTLNGEPTTLDVECSAVVEWTGSHWTLAAVGADKVALGPELTVDAVVEAFPFQRGELFVSVPPTTELVDRLEITKPASTVRVVEDRGSAHYVLAGRFAEDGIQYSWVRPGAHVDDPDSELMMPVASNWADVDAAKEIGRLAKEIGRVRAWMQIEPPPPRRSFPYRLQVRDSETKEPLVGKASYIGRSVDLVLVADRKPRNDGRWVYVFAINSNGGGNLLHNSDTRLPTRFGEKAPLEIVLEKDIEITEPPGTDTLVFLSSKEKINDHGIFSWDAVLEERATRSVTRGGPTASSELDQLLGSLTEATRGRAQSASHWSIERVQFVTRRTPNVVPAASPKEGKPVDSATPDEE